MSEEDRRRWEQALVDGDPISPDDAPLVPEMPATNDTWQERPAVPDFPAPTYEELIALLEPHERDTARMINDDTGIPPDLHREYNRIMPVAPQQSEIDHRFPEGETLRYAYAGRVYAVVRPAGLSRLTDLKGNLIRMFRNDWVFYTVTYRDGENHDVCGRATYFEGLPLREGLEFVAVVTDRKVQSDKDRKYSLEGVTRKYVRTGS